MKQTSTRIISRSHVSIMGNGCGKVLPESSKGGYFCPLRSVACFRKHGEFDGFKDKRQACLWSWRRDETASNEKTPGEVKESVHFEKMSNPNVKFRVKFDARVTGRYDIKALIGRGSFSRVVRAEHRRTRQPFAIKLLEVRGCEGRDTCHAELGVLRRVNHANVIHLVEVFETAHRVYLVLELATGGELLERVVARGTFRERDATRALMMVANGLRYLHALGIIHRDLKPENLLYYHPGQDSRLIITDFGLACWDARYRDGCVKTASTNNVFSRKTLDGGAKENATLGDQMTANINLGEPTTSQLLHNVDDKRLATLFFDSSCNVTGETKDWALRTLCGTPEYLAPEMVSGRPYNSAVDMWALGVITYILLSGSLPFDQNSRPRLLRAILKGCYSFHGNPWKSVSTLAKSFIDRLLTFDPEERMTAEEALKHPWLVSMAACSSNKNLHRSISRNLQQRASRASSRRPSSGSAPGSRLEMRSGSRPGSSPRVGLGNKSQCSLKVTT